MKTKLKFFLMVFLGALCIGGSTMVFAGTLYEGNTMTISNEDGVSYSVPFIDVNTHDYLLLDFGNLFALLVDPEMVGNSTHRSFYHKSYYNSSDGGKSWELVSTSGHIEFSCSYYHLQRYISSCDISFDGTVVFLKSVVPPILVVQELPKVMLEQVKVIVPIAVACLAVFLTSCMLLPILLHRFLRS